MKTRILIFLLLTLSLQSCLDYVNTISWEDAENRSYTGIPIGEIPNYKLDTSNFKLRLEIERSNREFFFPFILSYHHINKPIYIPVVEMMSRDQSINTYFDFTIELLTLDSILFFSQQYPDTVYLEPYTDGKWNGGTYYFQCDTIPELKAMKDSILVNYSLKTIDWEGIIDEVERTDIIYIRTHYKYFGSFY